MMMKKAYAYRTQCTGVLIEEVTRADTLYRRHPYRFTFLVLKHIRAESLGTQSGTKEPARTEAVISRYAYSRLQSSSKKENAWSRFLSVPFRSKTKETHFPCLCTPSCLCPEDSNPGQVVLSNARREQTQQPQAAVSPVTYQNDCQSTAQ
ncbi:hypothetical protein H920_08313 [Fukomys damarensis]|uniref:Uncharacterized protein n=1 Tax=Fukomys damarensis TaxID=885580 RepID=A0A091DGU7_FUKDA|nr:hypothetical protein H920_08313 [Fukomys damarensis]